jgi:hypothetical protein
MKQALTWASGLGATWFTEPLPQALLLALAAACAASIINDRF